MAPTTLCLIAKSLDYSSLGKDIENPKREKSPSIPLY
jgi:hypothetical protein